MTFTAVALQKNGRLVSTQIQRGESESHSDLLERARNLLGTQDAMLVQKSKPAKKRLAFIPWL